MSLYFYKYGSNKEISRLSTDILKKLLCYLSFPKSVFKKVIQPNKTTLILLSKYNLLFKFRLLNT